MVNSATNVNNRIVNCNNWTGVVATKHHGNQFCEMINVPKAPRTQYRQGPGWSLNNLIALFVKLS